MSIESSLWISYLLLLHSPPYYLFIALSLGLKGPILVGISVYTTNLVLLLITMGNVHYKILVVLAYAVRLLGVTLSVPITIGIEGLGIRIAKRILRQDQNFQDPLQIHDRHSQQQHPQVAIAYIEGVLLCQRLRAN